MAVPITPTVKLSEWDHHQYRQLEPARDGNFVSARSCLICAGPPLLSQTGGIASNLNPSTAEIQLADTTAYPIGLIQGFSTGQNRNHMKVYEIGSDFDYNITGRFMGNLTISKIFYSSLSLLRVLYAYYGTTGEKTIKALFDNPLSTAEALNKVWISPGTQTMFLNMFSDLFLNPLGIMLVMVTSQNNHVGAFYYERALVHGHNFAFDAQGMIIQENATLSFSRVAPVNIESTNILAALKNFSSFFDLTGDL